MRNLSTISMVYLNKGPDVTPVVIQPYPRMPFKLITIETQHYTTVSFLSHSSYRANTHILAHSLRTCQVVKECHPRLFCGAVNQLLTTGLSVA